MPYRLPYSLARKVIPADRFTYPGNQDTLTIEPAKCKHERVIFIGDDFSFTAERGCLSDEGMLMVNDQINKDEILNLSGLQPLICYTTIHRVTLLSTLCFYRLALQAQNWHLHQPDTDHPVKPYFNPLVTGGLRG